MRESRLERHSIRARELRKHACREEHGACGMPVLTGRTSTMVQLATNRRTLDAVSGCTRAVMVGMSNLPSESVGE